MNFNNLLIGKKIALVFSVAAVSILGLGLLLLSELQNIKDSFLEFTDMTVPSVRLAYEIDIEATKVRVDQYANIVLIDDPQIKQYVQDDINAVDGVSEQLAKYKATLFSENERRVFNEVEKTWNILTAKQEPYRDYLLQHNADMAKQVIVNSFDEYKAFVAALVELNKVNLDYIETDRGATLDRVQGAVLQTAIGIACIIAFMIVMTVFLSRKISRPLVQVMGLASEIASGNLTHELSREEIGNDELGQLADSCTEMQTSLCTLVTDVNSAIMQLGAAIEEVSAISEQSSQGMHAQQDEITLVATAMEEMQCTVNEVASTTENASTSAAEATSDAEQGNHDIHENIVSIERVSEVIEDAGTMVTALEENSTSISMVVDVISGIADQTNLLALNAAIEAARAGEQGRGFAVVADEVRTLAGRTQSSTDEIVQIIESLQQKACEAGTATQRSCEMIRECVVQSQQAGERMTSVENAVSQLSDMNTQIASACSEQNSVTEDLSRNVTNINASAAEVAIGSRQTAQACVELSKLSVDLQELMNQFRVHKVS